MQQQLHCVVIVICGATLCICMQIFLQLTHKKAVYCCVEGFKL